MFPNFGAEMAMTQLNHEILERSLDEQEGDGTSATQAAMIDSMVELAKADPELMPRVQQSVRQGARASGVDMDAMQLTPGGFVTP